MLLHPKKQNREYLDKKTEEIMEKTIEFFENKGLKKIKEDDHERVWYSDFLDFVKKEKIFATLLTPSGYGAEDSRWDMWRINQFNEILAFYGLGYWYTWQVSILGLGPIWMSKNEAIKNKTAQLLQDGGIFAFGLSEKEHGADIYSSEMAVIPQEDGTYVARGSKYYIGNGNKAALVSTFGVFSDGGDPNDEKYGKYIFFTVDSQRKKEYELLKNIIATQCYVAEYALHDYPITEADILSKGRDAWDATLNTVNVGKVNLGWASIGICTHAFYEAINHAAHRRLFDHYVTDFTHIQSFFVDAYCRLLGMKLFALRGADYMRSASPQDRRYLLYNPMVKMKVTTEGENVINLLWDIIAAKGFEYDTYFEMAARDIRALPKLEGTVHVNMALIIKFMPNYFFKPKEYPEVPKRNDVSDDAFLFNQGQTKGLTEIQFHDYNIAYNSVDLPNVNIFKEQIGVFKEFMMKATPTMKQAKDIDFVLLGGELFTLVVYGQLLLENAKIYGIEDDVVDQMFDFIIRDFSKYALMMYSKPISTDKQVEFLLKMIKRPNRDDKRFKRVWENHVYALKDTYVMNE
jgi:acyl-CoA dehydrogenase